MDAAPSLRDLVDRYLLRCEVEGKSPRTVRAYRETLGRFLRSIAVEHARAVTPEHLYTYLGHFTHLSLETRHRYFRKVRCFFNWLVDARYLEENPFRGMKNVRLPQRIVEPFSPDDVARLLAASNPGTAIGVRNRAIVLCLLDTGVRCSELVLSLDDLDLAAGRLPVRRGSAPGLTRCFRQGPGTRLHRPRKTCETRRSFTAESPQPASWRGPVRRDLRESPSARDFTEAAPKFLSLAPAQLAPHLSNLKSAVRACLRPTSAPHGAGRAGHGSRRARAPMSSGPLCCVGDVCSSPHGSTPLSLRFPCSFPADLNLAGDQLLGSATSLAKRPRQTRDHRHGTVISPTPPDVGTCELRLSGRTLVSYPSPK